MLLFFQKIYYGKNVAMEGMVLKKILILILFLHVGSANASTPRLGLGFILGNPTGFSANYRLLPKNRSIDVALAFDLINHSIINLHTTYLWHYPNAMQVSGQYLGWYYGLGAKLQTKRKINPNDEISFGPRASLGVNFPLEKGRFDLFGETALTMNIFPRTNAILDLAIGGRIYF